MNIIETTKTRLVVKHTPVKKILFGSSFLILALMLLVYAIFFEFVSIRLNCSRTSANQINCELRKYNAIGVITKSQLFDPQQAYINSTSGSRGSRNYQVIIITPYGEFGLLKHARYENNRQFITAVNNFIISQQSNLSVQQHQREHLNFTILILLIGIVISAYVATTPISKCTFYKSINKIYIEHQSLRLRQNIEKPLEEFVNIEIKEKISRNNNLYQPVIVFINSERIPMILDTVESHSGTLELIHTIKVFLQSS